MTKKSESIENGSTTMRISQIGGNFESEEKRKNFLELQLQMATSSINHEYARMEFDETECRNKKDELLAYMHDCRVKYFEARETLEKFDPYALLDFEKDLMMQKFETMKEYNA